MSGAGSFEPDDYRKRVLAAIEAHGGVPASDPFEWYDLPLEDSLKDGAVRSQVDAVWGFWQKQRQAPKYRGLVLALLARHEELAPLLWDKRSRRDLADQVREQRAVRAVDRFDELDAAAERLVERFGGIPHGKVAGLVAFAAGRGIAEDDARRRLTRWPAVDDVQAVVAAGRHQRVRTDLAELGRLLEQDPLPSLFALLDLPPTATRAEIVRARDAVAQRNRETLPDRRRALLDDLLASVTALLLDGDPQAYLSVLAVEVTDALRPRFTAAVLVEDVLTTADARALVEEAQALGLDPARAHDVVAQLAREAGVSLPSTGRPATPPVSVAPATSSVPERYRRAPRPARPAPPAPEPVTGVRVTITGDGATVSWTPSPTEGVEYRVAAVEADGRRRVLGVTSACSLEVALPRGAGTLPSYAVTARRDGVDAPEVRAAP